MQIKQELLDSLPICIKRGPYIDYIKFPETVEMILEVLRNYEKGDIAKIVKKTGFKERTMYEWLSRIKSDPYGGKQYIQFIAKGKTSQVIDTQLGDVYPHKVAFSEKGWSTNDTIYEYLNYIKSLFNDNEEIHVILDIYSSHRSDETKEAAKALGITLHFIPAGYTDLYQPLDVKIFAIIKVYIKHILRTYLREGKVMTKQDACRMMIAAWEKLEPARIQEAFEEIVTKKNGKV